MRNNNVSFIRFFAFLALIGLFSACEGEEKSADIVSFFSIENYFNEQIQNLEKGAYQLEKTLTINERAETKKTENIDYQTELAPFVNHDINRPAWSDKYSIDSLIESGQLKTITYQALDASLKTQSLSIHFVENERVSFVSITTKSHSVLSDSEKKLDYYPLSRYNILSKETTKTGDIVEVEIAGRFVLE